MPLEEKLDKEAIAVAAGNTIHIYSHSGSFVPGYFKRPGEVLSLTVHRGRLLDSGKYDGIRDTLTDEIVHGKGAQWRCIAGTKTERWDEKRRIEVPWEHLYGAMLTNKESLFGIYQFTREYGWMRGPKVRGKWEPWQRRNGPTTVLFGSFICWDGGDYIEYDGWGNSKEGFDKYDRGVASAHDRDSYIAYGLFDDAVTAIDAYGDDAVYTCTWRVYHSRRSRSEHDMHRIIYESDSPLAKLLKCAVGLQGNDDVAAAKQRALLKEADRLTKGSFVFDPQKMRYGRPHLDDQLEEYVRRTEGFTGIAVADGRIFIGNAAGALGELKRDISAYEYQPMHTFGSRINALCTIPEEVFDDGLRQRIGKAIQTRALHAKANVVKLRRIA